MSRRSILTCWFWAFATLGTVDAHADGCPNAKDEIATDRPDVTNSSLVVPTGSVQNENGVNFSARDGGRTIDGTNSRWRVGVAPCLELLVDLPTYFGKLWILGYYSGTQVAGQPYTWEIRPVPCRRRRATDWGNRYSGPRYAALPADAVVVGTTQWLGPERYAD